MEMNERGFFYTSALFLSLWVSGGLSLFLPAKEAGKGGAQEGEGCACWGLFWRSNYLRSAKRRREKKALKLRPKIRVRFP